MSNQKLSVFCLVGLSATLSLAQEGQKPNLSGSWQLSVADSKVDVSKIATGTWLIEQDGPSIHILRVETLQDSKESKREIRCTTDGKQCTEKGIKISFWYNGDALVELDVAGETTSEYSMSLAPGGKTLTVDVTHITPVGDREKLVFDHAKSSG